MSAQADFVGKFERHEFKVTWFGPFAIDRVEQDSSTSASASFKLSEQNAQASFSGGIQVGCPAEVSGRQLGKLSAAFDPPLDSGITLKGLWLLANAPG